MSTPIDKSIFYETGCIRKEQLLRYRDLQLSGREQHEVEEHLVDCILCSEALDGLALVAGTTTLDSLRQEVSNLVSPAPSHAFRPWLAAATVAGVVLFSYFTYNQYKNLDEEKMAVNEQIIPVEVPAAELSISGASMSDTAPVVQQPEVRNELAIEQKQKQDMMENSTESLSETNVLSDPAEEVVAVKPDGAVAKITVPVAAAKDVAPVSTALKNTGNQNITYVDNVKVIDYNNYETDNIKVADVSRSTSSKYQNKKEKTIAAETESKSGMSVNRKADYLDLVADPVILFNNGRYESANAGFDKLLQQNSNDQNAAFYKGLSLYNMNQYNPALELLEPISNDSASPFMEEAKFYTAQSYISNGEVPKGKIILEEISNNNGFYSKKAGEVLRNIK